MPKDRLTRLQDSDRLEMGMEMIDDPTTPMSIKHRGAQIFYEALGFNKEQGGKVFNACGPQHLTSATIYTIGAIEIYRKRHRLPSVDARQATVSLFQRLSNGWEPSDAGHILEKHGLELPNFLNNRSEVGEFFKVAAMAAECFNPPYLELVL